MVRIQVMVFDLPSIRGYLQKLPAIPAFPHPTRRSPQLPIVGKCYALNLILSRRPLRNPRPVLVALLLVATEWRRARMPQDTLTITDNRTGKSYSLPVENGTIRAMDLRQIKTGPEDFGLMTYYPSFMNPASCRSAIP